MTTRLFPATLADYTARCRTEATRLWGYADLPADHPERTAQAFGLGEDPADFVQWLGDKYDLEPVDQYGWGRL